MYKLKNKTLYKSLWIFLCVNILASYTIPNATQRTKDKTTTTEDKVNTSAESSKSNLNISSDDPGKDRSIVPSTGSTMEPIAIRNYATEGQAQLLKDYLNTSSDSQFLFGLIQATTDNQKEIRDAALEVIRKVLEVNPSCANSNSLGLISELFATSSKEPDPVSIFQLLNNFLEANLRLSKEIVELAFAIIRTHIHVSHAASEPIAMLFRNIAAISLERARDIILMAQNDADDRDRNEQVRVEVLKILNSIADIQNVSADLPNLDMLFNIVLQDAQDSSIYVSNEVVTLISTIKKINSEYVQKAFLAILRTTKSEDYVTRSTALNTLRFFLRAEAADAEQVFQAAMAAMADKQPLVRWNALAALATVVKSDPNYTQDTLEITLKAANEEDVSVSTMALRLLSVLIKLDDLYPAQALDIAIKAAESKSSEVCIEALKLLATIVDSNSSFASAGFEVADRAIQSLEEQIRLNGILVLLSIAKVAQSDLAEKVFAIATKLMMDKSDLARQNGLEIIKTIVQKNPAYAKKALEAVTKLTADTADDKINVRISAMATLESLLKADPELITDIYKTATLNVKDKNIEVRRHVWYLLQSILETDAEYVYQKEFRSMIREASLDSDATVRQIAHELLVNYVLKKE